jgi:hypothetical protein
MPYLTRFRQFKSQFLQASAEGIATRVFAQHNLIIFQPNQLGIHNFICEFVLQHAILVNARFMGKGIGTDNRLLG